MVGDDASDALDRLIPDKERGSAPTAADDDDRIGGELDGGSRADAAGGVGREEHLDREGARVGLVVHRVGERHGLPSVVAPVVAAVVDDTDGACTPSGCQRDRGSGRAAPPSSRNR